MTRFFRALCRRFWILFFLAATGSHAAENDTRFDQWFAVQTNLQSWSGDFTQTRSLKVLAQPLVSTGKVWVKPGEFRWELGQPAQTIVLRRPDQLLIIYPRLKRAEKYPLDAVPTGPMRTRWRCSTPAFHATARRWKKTSDCCQRRKQIQSCK